MKHIIIGTAGHVDHGKTALVKTLTGVDTDRLQEEKKRGISIDLGFASLKIGEFLTAGIVDVPGHERFLKNMLAGTGAIDLAILVIAADESVMPQTREHLDMLNLLGVKQGIIAVNKIDKADADWLELIEEEIRALTADTFLKDAPLCRVSALTGEGVENLKETILKTAEQIPARNENAPFRYWIDRVFSAKGHGAVVTGSILSGQVKVGDTLAVYPADKLVRVRALETHEEKRDILKAGQRAAINISGLETADLGRGMSLSSPERGEVNNIWEVKIDWQQKVKSATRVRLHLGTAEVLGRVYKYKDAPPDYMRLILEKPLAAATGDKAILRLYSPQTLLGAVTFLSAGGLSRKFKLSSLLIGDALPKERDGLGDIITGRLTGERRLRTMKDIARLSGYWPDAALNETIKKMTLAGLLIQTENGYLLKSEAELTWQNAQNILKDFHSQNSQESGLGKEILRQRLHLEEKTFENLLSLWQKEQPIVLTGGGSQVAQKSHALKVDAKKQDIVQKSQPFLNEIGFENIDPVLLGTQLGLDPKEAKRAQETLLKTGSLVKLGTMFLANATIKKTLLLLQKHFTQKNSLNISEFKDITGVSRKIAVPLLEYLDTQKYTLRDGDTRKAMPKLLNFAQEKPYVKQ